MADLAPLPGFLERDDARHCAFVRWHRSWPALLLLAAIWNFVLPLVTSTRSSPPYFMTVGLIAGFGFSFLAFRAFVAKARITLDEKGLEVRNPWAPWSKVKVPLADIMSFEVKFHEDGGHTDVALRLRSGELRELPIDWQPVPIAWKGSRKRWLVAPPAMAAWVAGQLEEMLLRARQLGHDTFRT